MVAVTLLLTATAEPDVTVHFQTEVSLDRVGLTVVENAVLALVGEPHVAPASPDTLVQS